MTLCRWKHHPHKEDIPGGGDTGIEALVVSQLNVSGRFIYVRGGTSRLDQHIILKYQYF